MSNSEKLTQEPDWKAIALALKDRLVMAVTVGNFGTGIMIDPKTMDFSSVHDYFADALEMVPGLTVNRDLLKMTPAQRRKVAKSKGKS